jgi:hypothetical protein
MAYVDLDRFAATPLERDPCDHVVVPGFLRTERAASVRSAFPKIAHPGLVPLSEVEPGPGLAALLRELSGADLEAAFSEKFGIDLAQRALMVTLRGRCQAKDGRIHTDSDDKIVTALLYLNEDWHEAGGRLRFLRGSDDIEDFAQEVAPDCGTLVAFRRSERSYHGHKPFVGERRYVMLNWMASRAAAERELARHRLSARVHRFSAALFAGSAERGRP